MVMLPKCLQEKTIRASDLGSWSVVEKEISLSAIARLVLSGYDGETQVRYTLILLQCCYWGSAFSLEAKIRLEGMLVCVIMNVFVHLVFRKPSKESLDLVCMCIWRVQAYVLYLNNLFVPEAVLPHFTRKNLMALWIIKCHFCVRFAFWVMCAGRCEGSRWEWCEWVGWWACTLIRERDHCSSTVQEIQSMTKSKFSPVAF